MSDRELIVPNYWLHETSGMLYDAIRTYFNGDAMTPKQIDYMRAYLRQWIANPAWIGNKVVELRAAIDGLTSRQAIERWLDVAEQEGIDPI